MKKREIPKSEGKSIYRNENYDVSKITVEIPAKFIQSPKDDEILQLANVNLLLHNFIAELRKNRIINNSILKDIEFMVSDYVDKFSYCNFDDIFYDDEY